MKVLKKIGIWAAVIVVAILAVVVYIRYYFVFGEGVKAGELNQVMYKGWVWKTYEGRIIQTGFRGSKTGSGIQSNEFEFSVTDKAVADSLMRCGGKMVELHYKEYRHPLPWRGMQNKVVDQILSVSAADNSTILPVTPE